jgi:hypothetical protein
MPVWVRQGPAEARPTGYNRRMAVVTSGNETIVRYGRGLIGAYYGLMAAAGVICVLSLLAGLGAAVTNGSWKDKGWTVFSWIFGALAFALMAAQLYTMGRAYARTYVAIGPDGIRLKLARSGEWQFKWDEISDIEYEGNLKKRVCKFQAGEYLYTLDQNNCPSPGIVAKLLVERKGVALK